MVLWRYLGGVRCESLSGNREQRWLALSLLAASGVRLLVRHGFVQLGTSFRIKGLSRPYLKTPFLHFFFFSL